MATPTTQEWTGTVEFLDLEGGVWVLTTPTGQRYQLFRAPRELLKEGLSVTITGQLRQDMLTTAQVGQVLEVSSFRTL
ncbi:MAG: hypothetical protein Q6J68_03010 [Thermostichales cyanobacterium SZTDM-1c_bins_54]